MTYAEYLAFLNVAAPGSVSGYDVALSEILPLLKDFALLTGGNEIAGGILDSAYNVNNGFTLPAGIGRSGSDAIFS